MTQKTFLKIDEKLHKKFIKLVKGGMTKPEACAVLGVGASTMRRYEQQLRDDVNYTGELSASNNGLTSTVQKENAKPKKVVETKTETKTETKKKTTNKEKPISQKELDKIISKVKISTTKATTSITKNDEVKKKVAKVTASPTKQEVKKAVETKPKSEVKKKVSRSSKK